MSKWHIWTISKLPRLIGPSVGHLLFVKDASCAYIGLGHSEYISDMEMGLALKWRCNLDRRLELLFCRNWLYISWNMYMFLIRNYKHAISERRIGKATDAVLYLSFHLILSSRRRNALVLSGWTIPMKCQWYFISFKWFHLWPITSNAAPNKPHKK